MNPTVSMTTKEIAEVTGKIHSHVLRDTRTMIAQLYPGVVWDSSKVREDDPKLDHLKIQGVTIATDNRGYIAEITLDKQHTFTLVSGYDARMRMAAIQYINKLEAQLRIDPQIRALPTPQPDASLLLEVIQSLPHAAQVDVSVRLYRIEKAEREVAQEPMPSNEYCRMYRETKAQEEAERKARKALAPQYPSRRRRPMDS